MPFEYVTTTQDAPVTLPLPQEIYDAPNEAVLLPTGAALRGLAREVIVDAATNHPGPAWIYLARHVNESGAYDVPFLVPLVQVLLPLSKGKLPPRAFAAQAKLLAVVKTALEQPSQAAQKARPVEELLQKRYDAIMHAATTLMAAAAVVENELQHLAADLKARLQVEVEEEALGTAWSTGRPR